MPDPAVLAAYLAPWQAAYPGIDLDRATSLALLGDRVFQAISYDAIYRAQEEQSRWELAGMVSRFLRRLPELVEPLR